MFLQMKYPSRPNVKSTEAYYDPLYPPSISKNGQVVRLEQGRADRAKVYFGDAGIPAAALEISRSEMDFTLWILTEAFSGRVAQPRSPAASSRRGLAGAIRRRDMRDIEAVRQSSMPG